MGTHGDPYSSRFMADPGWVVIFSHVLGRSKTPQSCGQLFAAHVNVWTLLGLPKPHRLHHFRNFKIHLVSDGAVPAANFSTSGSAWMLGPRCNGPETWMSWTSAYTRRGSRHGEGWGPIGTGFGLACPTHLCCYCCHCWICFSKGKLFAANPRFARGESRICFDMLKSLHRV